MREVEKFACKDGDGNGDAGAETFREGDGADVEGDGQAFKSQRTSPR
jgi:hypothetical protein